MTRRYSSPVVYVGGPWDGRTEQRWVHELADDHDDHDICTHVWIPDSDPPQRYPGVYRGVPGKPPIRTFTWIAHNRGDNT